MLNLENENIENCEVVLSTAIFCKHLIYVGSISNCAISVSTYCTNGKNEIPLF